MSSPAQGLPQRAAPGSSLQQPVDPSALEVPVARCAVLIAAGAAAAHLALWLAVRQGWLGSHLAAPGLTVIAWAVILAIVVAAATCLSSFRRTSGTREERHRATLDEIQQLEAHNDMLQALAQSTDVTLAFQALARRVARVVPCDRVGLALLAEGGQEFQTYTARVNEPERRARPRTDLTFNMERSHLGQVVRSGRPLIIRDFSEQAADFLDANVLHQTGFKSGIVLPLLSKSGAVGTLNVVSRMPGAFTADHQAALEPIAEILAMACVAQRVQQSEARYRTMEAMAELTLSIASEIHSALQMIAGQCELLERGCADRAVQRDVAVIALQARRIQDLLERMRIAAQERLREVAELVQAAAPAEAGISAPATAARPRAGTPGMPGR